MGLETLTVSGERLRHLEMIEGLSSDYESIFFVDLDEDRMQAYRVSERFEKVFGNGNSVRKFTGFDADYIKHWVYPADRKLVEGISKPESLREKLSHNKAFHIIYRILRAGEPDYIQLRVVNAGKGEHISEVVMGYRTIDRALIKEIEQRKSLEDSLNHAIMANQAKNTFLANMSHDVRTPMNAIVGFCALAKKHLNDKEKLTDYLNMITTSSDMLLQLLNNILEITRIESDHMRIDERECSLTETVNHVQLIMQQKAAAKFVCFFSDVSQLKHDCVFCDPLKLTQALMYLADNAIKYTEAGDQVTVSVIECELSDERSIFQFAVEDNGVGISEDFISHVFEPFEREKNTTLSGIHGSGLGLTIVKKIVETMGGTIEIASKEGFGSKFTITLNLLLAGEDPDKKEEDGYSPEQVKILIVDDNEINLEIGTEILKDAGYLVDSAMDGSIAVERIKNSKPGMYSLILMDLQMPVMNGYDASKAIREIQDEKLANIPIIALSANAFEEDKEMAFECGMNGHLAKPINTAELYEMIHKTLCEASSR